MTCPLCNDTGRILVVVVDKERRTGTDEWRPCPMRCKPTQRDGDGVGGSMTLEGREGRPPELHDYKKNRGKNRIDWKKHYLGRNE